MPVSIKGSGGGSVTLDAGAAAADTTLTLPNTSGTVINTAPSTAGNVLTSNGTAWTSAAPTGGVTVGTIVAYGSSTAPSGYLKCDGSTYTKSSYSALATVLGSLPVQYAQYTNTIGGSDVAYLNGNVAITASAGTMKFYYSNNNGASFTTVTLTGTNQPYQRMVWTGTNYVAQRYEVGGVGTNGIVYTSSLAATAWTAAAVTNINYPIGGIAYNGSRIIVVAGNGSASHASAYSTNHGVSWTAGGDPGHIAYGSGGNVAYGAGITVSVGANGFTSVPSIATTTDGVTWTQRTVPTQIPTGDHISACTYQNSQFIAIGSSGQIITSADGITWAHKATMGSTFANKQIVYLASTGLYYIYASNSLQYYSSDLITWNLVPFANTLYLSALQATDGTRIYTSGGQVYNPFPYTTATQFIVPNFGTNALGTSPVYGAYYYIKT